MIKLSLIESVVPESKNYFSRGWDGRESKGYFAVANSNS